VAGAETGDEDLIGRVLGGSYRIEQKLGGGGMGAVYRALDLNLEREIALKVIRAELATSTDFVQRFKREAKAAARFQHPNSVQVYSYGASDGLLYLALELVEGVELGRLTKEVGRFPLGRAVRIVLQILSALGKAHELGIVHRDVKPPNIMVTTQEGQDLVKILDFGIAKLREKDEGVGDAWKTRSGVVLGTPAYMSPEQAAADPVDARSDLYSAGIILYELVAGELPFPGPSPAQILFQQMRTPAEPLRRKRPDAPEALESVVAKALAKSPQSRWQDARSFSAALEASVPRGRKDSQPLPRQPSERLPQQGGPAPGSRVATYELVAEIGRGATGTLWTARHLALHEMVVLKVVHPALANRRERFLRDGRAALDLVHRNAVFVRDVGYEAGILFIVQDTAPGASVSALLESGRPFRVARALKIARQVLAALEEAHGRGIVHGRIGSQNVLLEPDSTTGGEVARLSDFGCAALGAERETKDWRRDELQDLAAVGALLHEMITGARGGPASDFRTLYSTDVAPAVEELIRKALLGRPGTGLDSAHEFGAAIDALLAAEAQADTVAAGAPAPAFGIFGATLPATRGSKSDATVAESPAPAPRAATPAPAATFASPRGPAAADAEVGFSSNANWRDALQGKPTEMEPEGTTALVLVANWGSNDVSALKVVTISGAPLGSGQTVRAGTRPVWVAVAPSRKRAYVANEASNEVTVYEVDAATGGVSPLALGAKAGAGTIAVAIHPEQDFVYAANSRSDDLSVFRVDESGALVAAGPPRPSGKNPRSLALDPEGRFLFVANYRSNNLTAYEVSPSGDLMGRKTVSTGSNPRAVAVAPNGRFAYVVNSGSNNVSVIAIDSGELKEAGRSASTGASPRSIAIDPSGRFAYVANSRSNDVSAYAIHSGTGRLTALGARVPAGNGPLAIATGAGGRLAFVVNYYSASVSVYQITPGTGELQPLARTLPVGTHPYAIAVVER
jgi:serine/threonine protein kinase/6-phosphogluconolactonase (cycloisomerase 2 family)